MKRALGGLILWAILTSALPIDAHTDEYFESVDAPHGGQLRMVGPFHLELVTEDKDITVYVTDHADNKITTEGGLAKATIETGPTKTQVHLHPVGDNRLKGSGTFSLTQDTVVIVFIKLPNQEGYAARFMPLKPKSAFIAKPEDSASPSGGDTHHHHHHPPKH